MKNPLDYVKHIVKDPITTIDEANTRKKEIMPLFFISLGVMVVGTLLMSLLDGMMVMSVLSLIGLVGVGFCGFLFFVISSAKKRFECLTCYHCNTLAEIKTPEEFARYVSFTVEKDEAVFGGYTGNKEPANGVYTQVKFSASASGVVRVRLTCPNCGQVKELTYCCTPFRCHAEAKNVHILDYQTVRSTLESAVRNMVDLYNDPSSKESIPYTFQSSKNPNFENRYEFKGSNGVNAHPDFMGVKIDYHKDVEELLLHYFVLNELTGTLNDPNPPAQKKGGAAESATASAAPSAQSGEQTSGVGETRTQPQPTPAVPTAPAPESAAPASEQSLASVTAPAPGEQSVAESTEPSMESSEEPSMELSMEPSTEPAFSAPQKEDSPSVPPISSSAFSQPPSAPPAVFEDISSGAPKKNNRKLLVVVCLAVGAAVLLGSVALALVLANPNEEPQPSPSSAVSLAPSEGVSSLQSQVMSEVSSMVPPNINDYVGYWHKPGSDKELAIHSGNGDSVNFSLWYDNRTQITEVTAYPEEDAFEFTLAANGGVVKGRLTFQPHSVMLHILQSTSSQMPVEVMTFTQQDFTSHIPEEETSHYQDYQDYENNREEDYEEPQLPYNEVPYLLSVTDDSYGIYKGPDYHSEYTRNLPKGTYTIVEEQYDEYDNLWGKLKSGVGWVCVERSGY